MQSFHVLWGRGHQEQKLHNIGEILEICNISIVLSYCACKWLTIVKIHEKRNSEGDSNSYAFQSYINSENAHM